MNQQCSIVERYDDLFSGEPDHLPLPSTQTIRDDIGFKVDGSIWETQNGAAIEHRAPLQTFEDMPRSFDPSTSSKVTERFIEQVHTGESNFSQPNHEVYGDFEDPVLWEDSDDTFGSQNEISKFDFVVSGTRDKGTSSPTESELIERGFEFHSSLSETFINQFLPEDHLRQACQDVDANLPRKIQWRAWQVAQDRYHFQQKCSDNRSHGWQDNAHEDARNNVPEVHEVVGGSTRSPCGGDATPSDIFRTQSNTSQLPGLELSRVAIVQSKPYLSDLKPTETRSQHSSLIPSSPQRAPSRASSLSSVTPREMSNETPGVRGIVPLGSPLREQGSFTSFASNTDAAPLAEVELLDEALANSHTLALHKGFSGHLDFQPSSINTPQRRSAERIGMESTRAVRGSPVCFPAEEKLRPDTPRPIFPDTIMHESIECDVVADNWTNHRSSLAATRSASPSPSSIQSVDRVENDYSFLQTPLRSGTNRSNSVDPLPPTFQLQTPSQQPGLDLARTICKPPSPDPTRPYEGIDGDSAHPEDPAEAERRHAWLKFDEVLRRAKSEIARKPGSVQSSSTHAKSEMSTAIKSEMSTEAKSESLSNITSESSALRPESPTRLKSEPSFDANTESWNGLHPASREVKFGANPANPLPTAETIFQTCTKPSQGEKEMRCSPMSITHVLSSPIEPFPTLLMEDKVSGQSDSFIVDQYKGQPTQLLEPWEEPPRIMNTTERGCSSSVIASTRSDTVQREPVNMVETSFTHKAEPVHIPSASIHDTVPISTPPESLNEIAQAIHQARPGQRSVTGTRTSTRGVARNVKKSRAVSTKAKASPTKSGVTCKSATSISVQGENVKIGKSRTSNRTTSRKTTIKLIRSNDIPAVPPLPEPEQMDIDLIPAPPKFTRDAAESAADTEPPALKVRKTRAFNKSSLMKSKPAIAAAAAAAAAANETFEEPKTPSRFTEADRTINLTPQSAGGDQATPRRRSPRLLEREEKAAAAALARRRGESTTVEMDMDYPRTPSRGRKVVVVVDGGIRRRVQDATTPTRTRKQSGKIPKTKT